MIKQWISVCVILLTLSCNRDKDTECLVKNLQVTPIECTSDSTYALKIDFDHEYAGNSFFDVYTRNDVHIGYYSLDSLPVTILNFKRSGKTYDFIKICINDKPDCCQVIEFLPPTCQEENCKIETVDVTTGECTSDSTYRLTIDFDDKEVPETATFNVFVRNNVLIGSYPVKSLPVVIPGFVKSGSNYDFIRICIDGQPDCCKAVEFLSPTCTEMKCSISNLTAVKGSCTSDSTYNLTLNFTATNPANTYFDVFVRKGEHIGYYKLSDLPVTIPDFKVSGKSYDFVKICINDHPDCCQEMEFLTGNCK